MAYETGYRLKKIRQSLNYTKKRMAAFLGVNFSGYSKNENGMTVPGRKSLNILSAKVGISMDWFLFDRGPVYLNDKVQAAENARNVDVIGKGQLLQANPEIEEMVADMLKTPLMKHELLAQYQRMKAQNKEVPKQETGQGVEKM